MLRCPSRGRIGSLADRGDGELLNDGPCRPDAAAHGEPPTTPAMSRVESAPTEQGTFDNLSFHVPWFTLGVIFLAVYAVAMAATFAPARRASRVYPAEALRYQ